jgi:hypothetical protein
MKGKFNKSNLDLRECVDDGKFQSQIWTWTFSVLYMIIFLIVSENYNCGWGWMPMVAMLGLNWKSKPPDSDIRRT